MDIRGIEVTNQLRKAIRAKLLELGVKYDEELPDYILVMVVNKKTRHQMHEDLHLFLENSTTTFVDWLHDQVLKKLQKVTIAKKKTREFVPAVVVKQEEKKKRKMDSLEVQKIKEEPTSSKSVEKSQVDESVYSRFDLNDGQIESLSPKANSPERITETQKKVDVETSVSVSHEEVEKSPPVQRRLKSLVNKPTITSAVSIKSRLGITSRNKFSIDKKFLEMESYQRHDFNRRDHFQGKIEDSRSPKNGLKPVGKRKSDADEVKSQVTKHSNVKSRLGVSKKEAESVKNRLGMAKGKFIALGRLGVSNNQDDAEEPMLKRSNSSTLKSRIIAVRDQKQFEAKVDEETQGEKEEQKNEEEKLTPEDEDKPIASKVIVTPRPLRPLQPNQKRATQSLLLRAVAEANQSVVQQKNPEPVLTDKLQNKSVMKRLESRRTTSEDLAVRINANKRLVMEKIQVELTTANEKNDQFEEPEPYIPRAITEEQIGVMMSLFQKGDDNQKFLVTLNGYNNNINKNHSDDDERMEIKNNEEEFQYEEQTRDSPNDESILMIGDNFDKLEMDDENKLTLDSNETSKEIPRKRRKLSPIVYNRSSSPVSKAVKSTVIDKKSYSNSPQVEKALEKCRYWPNCTQGSKCVFYHPPVLCSAFPACKFGDKCSYKHPKCKFGLSCTKLGCAFSHPLQQCKYFPYCVKSNCQFLHPQDKSSFSADITKFTWRKHE